VDVGEVDVSEEPPRMNGTKTAIAAHAARPGSAQSHHRRPFLSLLARALDRDSAGPTLGTAVGKMELG
jgi:hypothetical protein